MHRGSHKAAPLPLPCDTTNAHDSPRQDTQSAYAGHAGRQEGRSGYGDALPWKGHDMRLMAARRLRRRRGLAALSDEALYALLARIETLLLDRPHSGCHLAVEVLHDHEARLAGNVPRTARGAPLRGPGAGRAVPGDKQGAP